MKRLILALIVLSACFLLWRARTPVPEPAPAPTSPRAETQAGPDPAAAIVASAPLSTPSHYPPLDQLNQTAQTVSNDLRILRDLFFHYQIAVKDPSGNPAGTHEEIVRALQGRNRARLAFVPERHPALNPQGQLVDRWGTPYFFHALSSTRMEIRSAGPDRKMFTPDDALLSPTQREPRS
jgi:hypothetical protein